MDLYEYWNSFSDECDAFHVYAQKHLADFRTMFEQNQCRSVLSTCGSDLGISSPSSMTKYIIGKHKSGRVIKTVKPGQLYERTHYDSEGYPLAVERFNDIPSDTLPAKKGVTIYFVKFNGAIWTAEFSERGFLFDNHHKIAYDEKQRLKGFYKLYAGHSLHVEAEEYDYSQMESGIMICLFTYYSGNASGTSQEIAIGFSGSPATQMKYVVQIGEKEKFTAMDIYKNIKGEFVFQEHKDL